MESCSSRAMVARSSITISCCCFSVAVERQRGRELLNKRIDQLLLVVAQVTSGGQGGQQNTVLGMAVHQPPGLCRWW